MKRLVLLASLVVACGASPAVVVEVPPQQEPLPQPQQQQPQPQPVATAEEWLGTYTCAQGETDLALHVRHTSPDGLEAVFEFSHGPSNANGSYRMRGTIAPNGEITLVPGEWIDRPRNYVSVGMHGVVRGATFTGQMDNPTCSVFSLRRRS
jgi:hypothetical protein